MVIGKYSLIATVRSRVVSCAMQTMPKPPTPITFDMTNSPKAVPTGSASGYCGDLASTGLMEGRVAS